MEARAGFWLAGFLDKVWQNAKVNVRQDGLMILLMVGFKEYHNAIFAVG